VPFSAWQQRRPPPFRTVYVGLDLSREALYRRIDARVDEQIAAGLIDEVRALLDRGYAPTLTSMSGFGYRELVLYLAGHLSREAAVDQYKQATRHYARRQVTWFRPDTRIHWYDASTIDVEPILDLLQTAA
jgi:tRNA dimethylallyltransferase